MQDDSRMIKRREMIRDLLRFGALGGLATLVAGLRWRNGDCPVGSPCQRCPVFGDCGLPKARQARSQVETEGNHG